MESTESWGGACQVMRAKLQVALKEQVTLLESVQHLQSENSTLSDNVRLILKRHFKFFLAFQSLFVTEYDEVA
jgi:hypothetical protein